MCIIERIIKFIGLIFILKVWKELVGESLVESIGV